MALYLLSLHHPISRLTIALAVPRCLYYNGKLCPCIRLVCSFTACHCFFDTIEWHPWAAMSPVMWVRYIASCETFRMRVVLEGPFCRAWYLGKRFTHQTSGQANPCIPFPRPPPLLRTANDITDGALIDDLMMGLDTDLLHGPRDYTTFL